MEPVLGLETGYKGIVFLRAGLGNIQRENDVFGNSITTVQPNLGIGIKIKSISIDYALTDVGDQSIALYSNIFSFELDLNRKIQK